MIYSLFSENIFVEINHNNKNLNKEIKEHTHFREET